MFRSHSLLLASLLTASALAQSPVPKIDGPLTPEKAPESFLLEPALRIELVAAEPMVVSPVAMAFDERGRLFVAENRGYPNGPGEGQPPVGRIALLEDTDADGRMDKRTEFAEGLTFPNGVMPWKGGLIVTCAPDILYLKDTTGDGKSDESTVLFTGFATTGSTQLRVSHPTLSPDGWIYVTSGLTGGKVTCPSQPDKPAVELKRIDFRFRPDLSAWEAADGGAQFGMSFDDYGRRFICYNRVQVQHVVLSSEVLRRNPHLAFSETVQNCPADLQAEPLKGHGAAAKLFPISSNVTTADSHAGTFTAACAVTVWRGDGLPDVYKGGVFSCDPTGNLVHFDTLEETGATFAARRRVDGMEFLSSSDNWFRPVFLSHGPDGALYICDMYRKTIEHPDYLPVEIRKHTDFESGKTMGRIWRVVSDPAREAARRGVALNEFSAQQLCDALKSPNGWTISTAARLLRERADPQAVEPLKAILTDASAPPTAVTAALQLLDAQHALDESLLAGLTGGHTSPAVREQAVLLASASEKPAQKWLLDLARDSSPRVRFQVAIRIGSLFPPDHEQAARALAAIALSGADDRWTRAAVLSSLPGRESAFVSELTGTSHDTSPPLELLHETGRVIGAGQPPAAWSAFALRVLGESSKLLPHERIAFITGFAAAIRGKVKSTGSDGLLATALATAEHAPLAERIRNLFDDAQRLALDPSRPASERRDALELLAYGEPASATTALLPFVGSSEPAELQSIAIRSLGQLHDSRIAETLLDPDRFRAYPPGLRDDVLNAMLTQAHHLPELMGALEREDIPTIAIDALRRRQLTSHRDTAIRERANKLFGAVSGDRAKVYEDHKEIVTWKANAANGREVFKKTCAQCHRLDREGFAVGPDLFSIRNQPKESILLHILVPDHEITQGFTAYSAQLKDGRTLTGLITADTPTSITLRQPQAKEDTILRSDLEELAASQLSLMPQGLEKNITKQEFADLLAYLKGEKP